MKCKYCGMELPEGSTICLDCGKNSAKKKLGFGGIALVVAGSVVVLGIVAAAVFLLVEILSPRENNVYYKDNYVVQNLFVGDRMDDVVATVGEEQLTNAQLNVFYYMHIYNFSQYYEVDFTKPLHKQYADEETGMTWQQYFLECALSSWKQYQAITLLAEKAGFELPREYQNSITSLEAEAISKAKENGFKNVNEMLESDFGKGVTMSEYRRFFYLYYLSNLYYEDHKSKMVPTEEEMDAYYEENKKELVTEWGVQITKDIGTLVDVRHILVEPPNRQVVDGKLVFTEEDWAAGLAEAQAIYDEWLAGEATEDSFGDAAYINSEDGNSLYGGLYTDISKDVMVDAFEEWCFDESRKYGDHGIVKTEYGYHIMYFVGREDGYTRYCKPGALENMAMDYVEALMNSTRMNTDYTGIILANIDLSSK